MTIPVDPPEVNLGSVGGTSPWEWDKDYKPKQMPRRMRAEIISEVLGNGTREVPHVDSRSDAEWHLLWTADGQEICRVPQLRGDVDTAPVMRDIADAIANAGPAIDYLRAKVAHLLKALELAGSAVKRAKKTGNGIYLDEALLVVDAALAAEKPAETKEKP